MPSTPISHRGPSSPERQTVVHPTIRNTERSITFIDTATGHHLDHVSFHKRLNIGSDQKRGEARTRQSFRWVAPPIKTTLMHFFFTTRLYTKITCHPTNLWEPWNVYFPLFSLRSLKRRNFWNSHSPFCDGPGFSQRLLASLLIWRNFQT